MVSLGTFLISSLLRVGWAQRIDLADYVLTDTGTIRGGNTFPGVSHPLGMVKLGPDLYTGTDSYSGYQPHGNFTGFSMLHESGTGGAPKYGVVSQMPVANTIVNPLDNIHDTRAAPDATEVGYYRSSLGSGITVELSAMTRAGLYQYTFPRNATERHVIVDVSHVLKSYRGQGLEQHYLGGSIMVAASAGEQDLHYEGYGEYDNGWNRAGRWRVYFCGFFDQPATFKTFLGHDATSDLLVRFSTDPAAESTARLGAVFSFNATIVASRVGVSFISSTQACQNVQAQIPAGTSLATVREHARQAWNQQVLSRVVTTDTNTTKLQQLYTAMYFMNLLPTNKTGENPLWQSSEPYYDDIFTFWDTHRCTTALLHILQPTAYEEFIRSWVDIWRFEGFMSDARSSFWNGAVQGGSNCDNVLADAYVKGVRGKINWNDAYAAMVTDAEVVPPFNNDPRDHVGSTKEGRGALPDWLSQGFISTRFSRSVSRAVEYSMNDFAVYQVAKGLRRRNDTAKYLNRSRWWRNHWNTNMTALNHTGFLGPRNASGFYLDQDPMSCGGCYWGEAYYQALPWEYTFNAHHDLNTLIALSGGAERFVDRLEKSFMPGLYGGNGQFGHTIFNPGNEPSFGTPYLYNYAGRQDLSVKQSRYIAKAYYRPTPDGLPGNSDAGAMESWLLWSMLGLYPMTGQTTFLVGSPWFENLTIFLGEDGDKALRITTTGGSEDAYYVQSLRVNGWEWTKAWVSWQDVFANGGTMDFVLGPEPKDWATGPPPPSPASEWAADAEPSDVLANLPGMEPVLEWDWGFGVFVVVMVLGFMGMAVSIVSLLIMWCLRKTTRYIVRDAWLLEKETALLSLLDITSGQQLGYGSIRSDPTRSGM